VLHPVGPLPAPVYWRRRLLVLLLLVALVVGGSWVALSVLGGNQGRAAAGVSAPRTATGPPALDQVVPSPAAVQVPGAAQPSAPAAPPGACSDDALGLAVQPRVPGAPAGTPVELDLVVTNTSAAPCTRALDAQLQEIVLLDHTGARLWGSDDCQPATTTDTRTLAPGQTVSFPVRWTGRTSAPGCAGQPVVPAPGQYVLRGRLDTKTTADATITLT
jgi:hypothetical protein